MARGLRTKQGQSALTDGDTIGGKIMTQLNRFNRRSVLAAGGAASVAAVAPSWVMGQAAGPQRGGHLTIGLEGASTGDSLDPRGFNSPWTAVAAGTIYNTLVEAHGPENELRPGLARAWETDVGFTRWVFDLVEGAMFHDGKSVTPADVIWSLNSHTADDSRSNSRAIVEGIADMQADGPARLIITLAEGNQFFPAMLSNYPLCIVPEGTTSWDGIGTGAYKVSRFSPGDVLEGVRNENYFKDDAAFVDSVALIGANDPASRLSAFQSGQLHIASGLDVRSAPLLQALPDRQIVSLRGSQFVGINMRCDVAPFDNPVLRRAMKLAIDRDDILARVYGGFGRIGNDTPVPPNDPLFAGEVPQHRYDPEAAAELYKQSGHSGPLTLSTSEAATAPAVDMATLFREHAARAGITINVVREPADGYWANVWGQAPFHSTVWGARPTVDLILTTAYSTGSGGNDTHWSNPAFDEALARARVEGNQAKRLALYAEAQRLLSEDGGAIIPVFGDVVEGLNGSVQGYVPGSQPCANFRAAEQVSLG